MTQKMTRDERSELATVIRMRAKVAREDADMRAAHLLADFEEELAREYPANDSRWEDITEHAQQMIRDADKRIAQICEQAGIRPEFRPRLTLNWWRRGDNGVNERRAELRKLAKSRADAMVKQAKLAITRAEAEARGRLAELSLSTDEAKGLLESLPTVEHLLPTLALREIEAATPGERRR